MLNFAIRTILLAIVFVTILVLGKSPSAQPPVCQTSPGVCYDLH